MTPGTLAFWPLPASSLLCWNPRSESSPQVYDFAQSSPILATALWSSSNKNSNASSMFLPPTGFASMNPCLMFYLRKFSWVTLPPSAWKNPLISWGGESTRTLEFNIGITSTSNRRHCPDPTPTLGTHPSTASSLLLPPGGRATIFSRWGRVVLSLTFRMGRYWMFWETDLLTPQEWRSYNVSNLRLSLRIAAVITFKQILFANVHIRRRKGDFHADDCAHSCQNRERWGEWHACKAVFSCYLLNKSSYHPSKNTFWRPWGHPTVAWRSSCLYDRYILSSHFTSKPRMNCSQTV